MIKRSSISQMDSLDLDECADFIREQISNPITIEDFDHRLIAYSIHGNWIDQARMETIMGRKVPDTVLNKLWQDGFIQQLIKEDQPIRIPAIEEVGLGDRVAISIRRDQKLLGYIWVQEVNHQLNEQAFHFLHQAAHAMMPKLYRRQKKQRLQAEKSQEFFWKLLLNPSSSHHEAQLRADELGISIPIPFTIFIFEMNHPSGKEMHNDLIYLLTHLKDLFPLSSFPLWTIHQNQLITVGGDQRDGTKLPVRAHSFVTDICKRMRARLKDLHITGTFGLFYSSFQQMEQSYRQAQMVLRMKKMLPEETASIFGYADLGIYRFLPQLLEKSEVEMYTNDRLERIAQYDQENGGDLLQTLETFLDCTGRMSIVIEKLHIHPNTLAYRLKRIAKVGEIHLDDPIQRMTIHMDLKIRKLIQMSRRWS